MAIFYFRTSIIKARSGKSAVASAAYITATQIKSKRLGQTFGYRNKEEVVFSEVLLPENAPDELRSHDALWNAVEENETKANSRFARQFVIAVPREWNTDESIEHSREFIKQSLVDRGMAVSWAFHDKENNPHIHIMATVRGFEKNGEFSKMQKSVFELDENGNKIPEIDKVTGEQKVRVRNRNGHETRELVWKRKNVINNEWNTRDFLKKIKKEWADTCNRNLTESEHIDSRSYKEQGKLQIPLVHEGAEARAALARGVVFDTVKENEERRKLNGFIRQVQKFISDTSKKLKKLKERITEIKYGKRIGKTGYTSESGTDKDYPGISEDNRRAFERAREQKRELDQKVETVKAKHKPRHRH